jgi:hypothetical protein
LHRYRSRSQTALAATQGRLHRASANCDADTRLVSAADKLHNVRSIVATYREIGDRVWERFHGKRDGTLWYYRTLLDEFQRKRSSPLIRELERAVIELEAVVTPAQ